MKTIIWAVLSLFCASVHAQVKVTVYEQSGSLHEYLCAETGEMRFSASGLIIDDGSGNISEIQRSAVRKLTVEEASGIGASSGGETFSVFPNPVRSVILVQGIQGAAAYTIYTADGRELRRGVMHDSQIIDVNTIPAGFYFLTINHTTVKFIKL